MSHYAAVIADPALSRLLRISRYGGLCEHCSKVPLASMYRLFVGAGPTARCSHCAAARMWATWSCRTRPPCSRGCALWTSASASRSATLECGRSSNAAPRSPPSTCAVRVQHCCKHATWHTTCRACRPRHLSCCLTVPCRFTFRLFRDSHLAMSRTVAHRDCGERLHAAELVRAPAVPRRAALERLQRRDGRRAVLPLAGVRCTAGTHKHNADWPPATAGWPFQSFRSVVRLWRINVACFVAALSWSPPRTVGAHLVCNPTPTRCRGGVRCMPRAPHLTWCALRVACSTLRSAAC